jgi:hypothetical protein
LENKKIFFDLILELEHKNIEKKDKKLKQNLEKLNSIYHSKDFYKIDNIVFINNFYAFSKKFLELNDNNGNLKKYYSIFLFEFLKNNLTLEQENIDSYINLLKSYINISNSNKITKKQIEEYIEFLSNIRIMIESSFFD